MIWQVWVFVIGWAFILVALSMGVGYGIGHLRGYRRAERDRVWDSDN